MRARASVLVVAGLAAVAGAQAPVYDWGSPNTDRLGASVTGIGDVNGDGHADIAIGATRGDGAQTDSGTLTVFSGKTGLYIYTLDGERTGDQFGYSVAALGDVTGDGAGDFVVGAPYHDPSWGGSDRGRAYVYSGANGTLLSWITGLADSDRLGYSVSSHDDINSDGKNEVAVSAPWANALGQGAGTGLIYVFSSNGGFALRTYNGKVAGENFGFDLDRCGDFNGDGYDELIVGASNYDSGSINVGRAYVLNGASSTAVLYTKTGATLGGELGRSVAGVPDLSGDGKGDFLVGEPYVTTWGGVGSGRVRVYSGASGALLRDINGAAGDSFGWSVAGTSDLDGDARGDIVVGAPNADWGTLSNAGLGEVFSGATGALLFASTGYYANEYFARAVGSAGDVNNDGRADVLFGSLHYNGNGADGGRARLQLGGAPYGSNYCTWKVNSQGCTPVISFGGVASVSIGDNLNIIGANVLPNVSGLMIWSLSQAAVPFYGGTLCVGAPRHRTPLQTSFDNGPTPGYPCQGVYTYLFTQAQMASAGLVPGSNLYAQYWSRDNGFAPPNNIGLTNALSVPILP